ncbi:MAG: TatD family hydrolase [Sphaerochaetaceae bacterium]
MSHFDAHFHLGVSSEATGILCTSKQEEWVQLAGLSTSITPSIGLLPGSSPLDSSLYTMETLLQENKQYQIGEVGLDKRFPLLDKQRIFLIEVFDLAKQYHRMVSIHSVQCDGLLLSLLPSDVPILWHGFTGSIETANQGYRKGVVFSLGPRIYKTKLISRINELKEHPFLLESDATENTNYSILLEEHYAMMAGAMHLTIAQLVRRIDETRTILTNKQTSW